MVERIWTWLRSEPLEDFLLKDHDRDICSAMKQLHCCYFFGGDEALVYNFEVGSWRAEKDLMLG